MTTIRANDRITIGDGQEPFIIAEIGSNWKTLDDCMFSIRMAKQAGANAVKFQLFDCNALYGSKPHLNKKTGELPPNWLPKLRVTADEHKIEFMCSAFSPELADEVNDNVDIHKIASCEMNHVRLLQKTNSFRKPVLLSTGASTLPEIEKALQYLPDVPVVVMYCSASYPAKDVNLSNIGFLKKQTGRLIGYSDHSTDIRVIPHLSFVAGSCVLEKHMTAIKDDTPDSLHSLTDREFEIMVKTIKSEPRPQIGPTLEEIDMVTTHKRRLMAIKNIHPGDRFKEGQNFGIYRALTPQPNALSPFRIDEVNGKLARRYIEAGVGIGPDDI